jgi:hypothetical protein
MTVLSFYPATAGYVEKLARRSGTAFQPVRPTGILPVESLTALKRWQEDARQPHSQDGCAPPSEHG